MGRATCIVLLCGATSRALAHPGPAVLPDFGTPECITVIDKRATPSLDTMYYVQDDVMPEPDHIPVPDQKTHQFMALRGQLSGDYPDYSFAPFDPTLPAPAKFPTWLNQKDLTDSAAANSPSIAPDFRPQDIGTNTLTERGDLVDQWLDIAPMRVPITERQARFGIRWDLNAVPAGVYQLVAYVYSPPYNAWEARPGVLKIVDGTRDWPAVTLDSVDASLFEGQGRKISGCLNAPAGTELRAYYRPVEMDPLSNDVTAAAGPGPQAPAWEMWGAAPSDNSGRFQLCFQSPKPGYSGIVEIKVVAVSPAGEQLAAYAPDQVVFIPKAASCTESSKVCCPAAAPAAPAAPATTAAVGTRSDAVNAAAPVAGSPAGPATESAGSAPTEPSTTGHAHSSGCVVVRAHSQLEWPMLALLSAAAIRLRQRARLRRAQATQL